MPVLLLDVMDPKSSYRQIEAKVLLLEAATNLPGKIVCWLNHVVRHCVALAPPSKLDLQPPTPVLQTGQKVN